MAITQMDSRRTGVLLRLVLMLLLLEVMLVTSRASPQLGSPQSPHTVVSSGGAARSGGPRFPDARTLSGRGKKKNCNYVCPDDHNPVCGSDEETYANLCTLEAFSCIDPTISLKHEGKCEKRCPNPLECPTNKRPVCGTDGYTYPNICVFRASACSLPELKLFSYTDCDAPCPDPKLCPFYYSPVCGSDGNTYINKCLFLANTCEDPELTVVGERPCFLEASILVSMEIDGDKLGFA